MSQSSPSPTLNPTFCWRKRYYCRQLTSAHIYQLDSKREPLVSKRKLLTTKVYSWRTMVNPGLVLTWGLRYVLKKKRKQKGDDDFEIGLEGWGTLTLKIKKKFIQKLSDSRKILLLKALLTCIIILSLLNCFDLPSYDSELRKRFLRLLLMCLEVGVLEVVLLG